MSRTIALLALGLALVACERKQPEPEPTRSPAAAPAPKPTPAPRPTAAPSSTAEPSPQLDRAALSDRNDPDRLLRYYAAALRARDWGAAARAWGAGSGVTAATLKAAYDRPEAPILDIGDGRQDAGAGSLFYEAPVVLRFGPGAPPETGTLSLRRVNDVEGAAPAQLRWHIERATIGVGQ